MTLYACQRFDLAPRSFWKLILARFGAPLPRPKCQILLARSFVPIAPPDARFRSRLLGRTVERGKLFGSLRALIILEFFSFSFYRLEYLRMLLSARGKRVKVGTHTCALLACKSNSAVSQRARATLAPTIRHGARARDRKSFLSLCSTARPALAKVYFPTVEENFYPSYFLKFQFPLRNMLLCGSCIFHSFFCVCVFWNSKLREARGAR